jgi:hypothetical protein
MLFVLPSLLLLLGTTVTTAPGDRADSRYAASLWRHDNLVATKTVHFDAKKRTPAERAEMLDRLGFRYSSYDWFAGPQELLPLDAEIEALQNHGITLLSSLFLVDADNPDAKTLLETFKRRHVDPQLWVLRYPDMQALNWPKPFDMLPPRQREEALAKMSPRASSKVVMSLMRQTLTKTPEEQARRVKEETDRVLAIVKLVAPYGIRVALYNHGGWNGWTGLMENQIAVVDSLKRRGIKDIGIVYNFDCARDELHDDTADFPAFWKKAKSYVVAVNVSGVPSDPGTLIYPGQGERELEMMRTIQESGWRGPIGLSAEIGLNDEWKAGDAEVTLRNDLIGLDWLAAELKLAGSGGPRPFPLVHVD